MLDPITLSKQGIEVWRGVVGYESSYEISNLGRVRSKARIVRFGSKIRHITEKLLSTDGGTYPGVRIGESRKHVHSLMAEAFLEPSNGRQVRHLDDDKQNPILYNLEYGTRADNVRDAIANGLAVANLPGEQCPASVLNEASVRAIRASAASYAELAKRYNVAKPTIGRIVRRETWKHI